MRTAWNRLPRPVRHTLVGLGVALSVTYIAAQITRPPAALPVTQKATGDTGMVVSRPIAPRISTAVQYVRRYEDGSYSVWIRVEGNRIIRMGWCDPQAICNVDWSQPPASEPRP